MSYKLLSRYFTTGNAESEDTIIDNAYVPTDGVLDIINPPPSNPRVLIGKKGSGKSIVIRYLRNRLTESRVPVMLLRPNDLDTTRLPSENTLAALIRFYKDETTRAIAIHLGRDLKGYLSDVDEIMLSKLAKEAKARQGDWYENILEFILPVGAGVANVDYTKLAQNVGVTDQHGIETAIRENLGKQEKFFYLLFDDTDQVADLGQSQHLNRIWAFLLALRQLMEKCPNIRCVVTLRSEVWIRLCRDKASQRDQVDHIRNLIYELNPTEEDVLEIIRRRFILAKPDNTSLQKNHETDLYFEGDVTLPGLDQSRSWYDFLIKRSRERPRDAIQLVAKLIQAANLDRSRPVKIKSQHAAAITTKYSGERVEDLRREVENECPNIEAILRTFAGVQYDQGGFSVSADVLLDHLKKVPSMCSVTIFGETIRQTDEVGAFKLWKYLFDTGFIDAKYGDSTKTKGYDHKSVRDDPSLISKGRWNELQKIAWDIHPAYRDFLYEIRAREYIGLPNRGVRDRPRRNDSR